MIPCWNFQNMYFYMFTIASDRKYNLLRIFTFPPWWPQTGHLIVTKAKHKLLSITVWYSYCMQCAESVYMRKQKYICIFYNFRYIIFLWISWLLINQNLFRLWHGTDKATNHFRSQWWLHLISYMYQGSHGSGKTWKVREYQNHAPGPGKVLELDKCGQSPGKVREKETHTVPNF